MAFRQNSGRSINDLRSQRTEVNLGISTRLFIESMLKIALPIIRKRFDFDCSAQALQVVFLENVKASDVGDADLVLLSPNQFHGISGANHSFANNRKIKTGAPTGQKTLDDISATKLYAEFVTGHSWFGDHHFRFADSELVPNVNGFLEQSLGREIFSEHSPG
jgi:hypothetical protein